MFDPFRFADNTHAEHQTPLSFTRFYRRVTRCERSGTSDRHCPGALLPGEKEADYAEVGVRFVSATKPRDAIEEFLIRDAIDLTWEILRLRRAKAGILKTSMNTGVEEVLKALSQPFANSTRRRALTSRK